MRCRVCGLELTAQDKLRNGAYRCPECGTIHHTASSSRKSPSPWRRRKSGLAQRENLFLRKFLGLPLWSWLAAVAVIAAVVVIVVLFVRTPGQDSKASPESTAMPAAHDEPLAEGAPASQATEHPAGATSSRAPLLIPSGGASQGTSAKTTGVALNDFIVSFDWAMNYLKYTGNLSESGQASGNVRSYSYGELVDVQLRLDGSGNVITGATVTARLAEGTTDSISAEAAFVSAFYALDNQTNAKSARTEVQKMLADSTLAYTKNNFSAKVTSSTATSYVLEVEGTL